MIPCTLQREFVAYNMISWRTSALLLYPGGVHVGESHPIGAVGSTEGHSEPGLEVRLVEAGERLPGVGRLELRDRQFPVWGEGAR